MRYNLILSVLILLCAGNAIYAQAPGKIIGWVNNSDDNMPVGSATVLLYRLPDTSLVRTAITSSNGEFELNEVKSDNYFITITHTGHKKKSTLVFSVNPGQLLKLPVIKLSIAEKTLSGVTVIARKPVVEVTADKTVFNVENSINATGSNAFELLQKSSGVVTDKDDNISMNGKSNVRIYIDGRLLQMETTDLVAYLRSVNAADIEAIEMITNPSARYDASGNAGIINIRFKRNKKLGYNGTVTAGAAMGKNFKTNTGISFNYRSKALNFYSSYSNAWAKNELRFNMYRKQNDSLYDQKNVQLTEGWSHNFKSGIDFFAAKHHTIGLVVTGNFNDNTAITTTHTPISSLNNGKTGQLLYANNILPLQVRNMNYNFNYRFADSAGNEVNFDADYGKYKSRRSSYQPNYYYSPMPEVLQDSNVYRNQTPNDVRIVTFKIDFEKPIGNSKLGIGVKYGNVKTDNSFRFYNVINGADVIDLARSNMFSYKENVNAAYVNYNTIFGKKWKLQAGLRLEQTSSTGMLTRTDGTVQRDDKVERKYADLFPSAAITHTINASNSLNLTYSRRIDRPVYVDLNPFENKLDELTYQKGNAFLKPQYANNIQLIHTFKGKYITTLGYSHINDFTAQIIDTIESKRSFITKRNLASQDIVSLNFSLPLQIEEWWSVYANINLFRSHYLADLGPGKMVDIKIISGSFYAQNSFTLGNGFAAEVSGFYNAPAVWAGTFRSSDMGSVDIGVQKLLFDKKATLKLSFTDVLRTMRWRGHSTYSGTDITAFGRWESRQVRLNFTYRFGNNQVKQARQRVTGSDDEKKRTESNGLLGN